MVDLKNLHLRVNLNYFIVSTPLVHFSLLSDRNHGNSNYGYNYHDNNMKRF